MDHYAYNTSPEHAGLAHSSCPLEIKSLSEEGVFAGYASVFHVVDNQQDVILPGAFTATLHGRAHEIKLLWQHDMREPIGIIEDIREDENGLYVKGRLLLEVSRAREAYSLLRQGVISGMSIGYTPRHFRHDEKQGVRLLTALDLWEISLVTFPANEAARVTVVKNRELDIDVCERQWGQLVRSGQVMACMAAIEHAEKSLVRLIESDVYALPSGRESI